MCIDSSSVKNQDLSPYRDFLDWNGKEQHRSSCQLCEAFPPYVIINSYPITPETSARIILPKFSSGWSAGGL